MWMVLRFFKHCCLRTNLLPGLIPTTDHTTVAVSPMREGAVGAAQLCNPRAVHGT